MPPEYLIGGWSKAVSTDARIHVVASRRVCWLGAVLGACAVALPAAAAIFPDLYTVTVEIDPAAPDRRAAAIERGMELLLTRVTGRPGAARSPELGPLVASAPRLVTAYGQVDTDRVRVGFNGAAVQSQLAALDWPLWGADRPQLVLWAAIDFGDGQRSLIGAENNAFAGDPRSLSLAQAELRDGLRDELVRAADERGLPLRVPLMDEADFQLASFAAVWGGFTGVLTEASSRYAADFVLNVRIAMTELGLEIDWQLADADGTVSVLRTSGAREGIDWVADLFAARFSGAGGLRETQIDIQGITSLVDYGRVMQYLGSVSLIESLDVAAFAGDVLELRASIRGDDAVLDRVFELGGVLAPVTEAPFPAPPASGGTRRYVLAGAGAARR